jgi:hypothetical protein
VKVSVAALATGAWAAVRAPGWIGGERLASLLRPAPKPRPGAVAPPGAVQGSVLALRVLHRVPGGRWRNTCLYRSVAECLVLRGYGEDARLRIGVGSEASAIVAHAWVVRGDQEDAAADPAAASLRPFGIRP